MTTEAKIWKYGWQLVLMAIVVFMAGRCANPVTPGGGPRDTQPPVVLGSDPQNQAIFFNKKTIVLHFDEFVKIKSPDQQVLISPPLEKKPEYRLRGKSLIIDLQSELTPNTTYTIFFGNAIVDLAEENPLANYSYVFSTGAFIDSMAIAGQVLMAFNRQPVADAFVMLYPPHIDTVPDDSLPMLVRPLYVAKTDKLGHFLLANLRNESYRIFALNDLNSNYFFDQPGEEIAFIDSLLTPEVMEHEEPDFSIGDTLVADTIAEEQFLADSAGMLHNHTNYVLAMFKQVDSTLRIASVESFYPPRFQINFSAPVLNPQLRVLEGTTKPEWNIMQASRYADTITWWITDTLIDSLRLEVSNRNEVLDTLLLAFTPPEKKPVRRPRDDEEPVRPERLGITANIKSRKLDLGKPLILTMDAPLARFNFDQTLMVEGNDTLGAAPFVGIDSVRRKFQLQHPLAEDTQYQIIFSDSMLYNIYGLTNDSLGFTFNTGNPREYGSIVMNVNLDSAATPYIIQLLDAKERVLREFYLTTSQKVPMEFLNPDIYLIKAIADRWPNRRWDTGIYTETRQPEQVYYFLDELKVRANWDIEKSWKLP
ncbi:MAG: hypothetical protein EOM83_10580 [Clostridia bacterium]|nr:hypothetical protein [Clostridia bacterium]